MNKTSATFDEIDPSSYVEECGFFEGYGTTRFALITGASAIALIGFATNILLTAVFSRRAHTPNTLYPAVLAALDSIICAVYILLFGIDAAFVYLSVETLFNLYHLYIIPVFVLSRMVQLAIPYMLIWATLERFNWIITSSPSGTWQPTIRRRLFSNEGRLASLTVTLILCAAFRSPMAFAMRIEYYPNCSDTFRSQSVSKAEWAADSYAYYLFEFQFMSVAQMFLPFIILIVLNMIIVRKLALQKREEISYSPDMFKWKNENDKTNLQQPAYSCVDGAGEGEGSPPSMLVPARDIYKNMPENYVLIEITNKVVGTSLLSRPRRNSARRTQMRNAIYTMVAIVISYLVCSSLHLILTILEWGDSPLLQHPTDPTASSTFYIVFSDVVSFLYMFTSTIRILIYAKCNPDIRDELKRVCIHQCNKYI